MSGGDPFVVLFAVALDLLVGDPRWLPHPVVGIGQFIKLLEKVLRRTIPWERMAGLLLLILTVGGTALVSYALLRGAYALGHVTGFAVATGLSFTCLAARSLHRESRLVADALVAGDLPRARTCLAAIVGRDTDQLGEEEIWRATIETVAENTSDGVIAPLFYLMLGGPVLAMVFKAINTLDSMVGYRNDRYLRFGWASARCDDLACFVPARLTGLLIVLAAPLVGYSGRKALQVLVRDGRNHASPNSGMPEAAVAGALGVRLGGINRYGGVVQAKPTIGDVVRPLGVAVYRGAVRLLYGAEVLMVLFWLVVI